MAVKNTKTEHLIKSKKRVKDFGEVFTPKHIVQDMCSLIPPEMYSIEKTFLEPACGNGNFLLEILERKLKNCHNEIEVKIAVESIYGIDIQEDNVLEARQRLNILIQQFYPKVDCMEILRKNIVVGDFLRTETVWFLKGGG